MKKRFLKIGILASIMTGTLFMQACGANGGEAPVAGGAPAPAVTETVVLYSNAVSDGRGEWIQERAMADLNIDVQLVDLGGVALQNRLIAERYNPMGDVIFGLNPMLWYAMEHYDIIVPHFPPWRGEIPSHLNHPDGLFNAVILVGNLLTYDLGQLSAAEAPSDWLDLWQQDRFHGRYALPNALTGSTVQMVLSGIFTRFLDPNGHLGVSDEGWENIAGKFRHGVVTDIDMHAEIVNPGSDVVLSQMWSHGVPIREAQHDIQVGFVVPSVGIPFSVEGVALINGAPNEEAARRFIDWFGQSHIMHDFSYQFGFLPAHPDALEGLGGITVQMAEVPHQQVNWSVVAPNIMDWLEHIYLTYMQ
jgi:iron(III) transport system substrate-binding protein